MFTKAWLLDTAERVIWTAAQTFLALTTVDGISDDINADWKGILLGTGFAALYSLVKCILATRVGEATAQGGPSNYAYTGAK